MKKSEQLKRVQDYVNLLGKTYIILLDILPDEDRMRFIAALEKTSRALSAENNNFQETLGSLLEPMQTTLAVHFRKK